MEGTIKLNVRAVCADEGVMNAAQLRHKLGDTISTRTATRLFNNEGEGITFEILALLCNKLARKPSDFLLYSAPNGKN